MKSNTRKPSKILYDEHIIEMKIFYKKNTRVKIIEVIFCF